LRFSAQPRGPGHALKTPRTQKSYRALALRRGYVRFLTRARGRRPFQSLFAPLRDARRPRGCASSRGSLDDRQSQKKARVSTFPILARAGAKRGRMLVCSASSTPPPVRGDTRIWSVRIRTHPERSNQRVRAAGLVRQRTSFSSIHAGA
jgi:hypothetical protein